MIKTAMTTEQLKKDWGLTNVHQVPRIVAVTLNVGVGKNRDSKDYLAAVEKDLAAIAGQKPNARRARRAVAGFSVREGNIVGYAVTLRGKRRDDFVKRFIQITLPRVRDFRGVPVTSFDGRGNLTVGLNEQLSFPEIHPEKTDIIFGLEVTLITSATNDTQGAALLRQHGFPLTEAASDLEE